MSPSTTGTRCEPVTSVFDANRRTRTMSLGDVPPPTGKPGSLVDAPSSATAAVAALVVPAPVAPARGQRHRGDRAEQERAAGQFRHLRQGTGALP